MSLASVGRASKPLNSEDGKWLNTFVVSSAAALSIHLSICLVLAWKKVDGGLSKACSDRFEGLSFTGSAIGALTAASVGWATEERLVWKRLGLSYLWRSKLLNACWKECSASNAIYKSDVHHNVCFPLLCLLRIDDSILCEIHEHKKQHSELKCKIGLWADGWVTTHHIMDLRLTYNKHEELGTAQQHDRLHRYVGSQL